MELRFDTALAKDYGVYPAIMMGYFKELNDMGIQNIENGRYQYGDWTEFIDDELDFINKGSVKKLIKKLVKIGFMEVDGNLYRLRYK